MMLATLKPSGLLDEFPTSRLSSPMKPGPPVGGRSAHNLRFTRKASAPIEVRHSASSRANTMVPCGSLP